MVFFRFAQKGDFTTNTTKESHDTHCLTLI